MKRIFVALCMIVFCSVLLTSPGTVMGSYLNYSHLTYTLLDPVTLDAKWTTPTEWTDTTLTTFGNTSNAIFRSKWELASMDPIAVNQYIIIEILNDNTDDPTDYWQLCFDGDESGGTAPQTGDIRIDITGHTTLTAYGGSGTGWTPTSAPSTFRWNNSMNTSPTSATNHWICEIIIDKVNFGIGADYWLRIAYFDASNAAAGVQAWPPTSRDVPNDWGDIPYSSEVIPESLSFAVVVLLSSVALIVGSVYLRKRPKTTILTPPIP